MSKSTKTETKSDAEKYDKKTPREHVLIRPDTYIGDVEPTTENMWIYSEEKNKIINKQITYTPGFLKVFDELAVNARDASVNDPSCDTIKFEYNNEEGYISVYNNGDIGIPVEEHPVHKLLVPSMIFGELLTSSNYNDTEERTTGGRNGYGSKCLCPNTKIPLWNGYIKLAKDIIIGDQIIGDDGTIRNVLKIINGQDKMYNIFQQFGDSYRVNSEHILTLHMPMHKQIFWDITSYSWSMLWWDDKIKNIKSKSIKVYEPLSECDECGLLLNNDINKHLEECFSDTHKSKKHRKITIINTNKQEYIDNAKDELINFSKTIDDNNIFDISIKDYIKLDEIMKQKLEGVRGKCVEWKFKKVYTEPYEFGTWLGNDSNPDKYIPNNYIINTKKVRLGIIAGLIDTIGSLNNNNDTFILSLNIIYKKLSDDIIKLSRTLGFICYPIINNDKYNIIISGNNLSDIPSKLSKKVCNNSLINNSLGKIIITESHVGDFVGFEIDNNQRFVINDFTVTHNCANIFSTKFIVEIDDAKRNKKYKQTWIDNMSIAEPAIVSKLPSKTKSSVKVSFYPDFKRFNIKDLNNDHLHLFHRRAYDIAGTANNKLKVFFNDKKIDVINFKSYIELYYPSTEPMNELYYDTEERWSVGVLYKPDNGGDVISFVNSINTYKGGTHCTHVIDNLIKTLITDYIKKKDKDIKITPTILKENLVFFINSTIINPAFSSQTKDTLTTKSDKFGSKYTPSPTFLKKVAKCGIVEQMIELAKFKENSNLKKTDGKKQVKISGIPKLEDANKAGGKESTKCTLILTEGDSAKATAMAGLGVIGRDYYGVFPLKGKLLNVREATSAQLLNNEEIKNLKLIIGLKQGEDYTNDDKFNGLRYGHVLLLTDQDVDGSHIKGLFINMLHTLWPSLVKRKEFVQSLNTPIVKGVKGKDVITFYNLTDYDNWKDTPEANNYKIKYYKGLGTSTTVEAKEYFIDIETKLINYFWENVDKEISVKLSKSNSESESKIILKDEESDNDSEDDNEKNISEDIFIPVHDDDDAIKLAFDKTRANDRKKWLMNYDKNNVIKNETKIIPYYDFIHSDLIHFSNDDLIRSIPSVIDGLKPSQRKILYGAFLRGLDKTEVKVAQLAGFVSDKAAYHHGEMSLTGAIIGMAQDFVGSNNINILVPAGQFGTRLKGGKDAASPRYIWTSLDKLTSIIFNSNDDPVLNNQFEDNEPIEPEYYAPIIPMILVNGAEGIGTGFSTKIPPYNPIDIIRNIRNIINKKSFTPMEPWWQGFEGTIYKNDEYNYEISGSWAIDDNKLTITELPVGCWTSDYKEFLEEKLEDTKVKVEDKKKKQPKKDNNFLGYKDSNTESKVHFELTFEDGFLSSVKEIDKLFKLNKKYSITNMHLYGPEGHIKRYNNVEEIMRDYYNVRIKLYKSRKEHQLSILEYQLKIISFKVKFILMVVKKEIDINNKKKSEIEESLVKNKFPKIGKNKDDTKLTFDYLLTMPLYNLSYEKIEELKKQQQDKEAEYQELEKMTPEEIWMNELEILEEEYNKWYKIKEDIANSTVKTKVKKSKKKSN